MRIEQAPKRCPFKIGLVHSRTKLYCLVALQFQSIGMRLIQRPFSRLLRNNSLNYARSLSVKLVKLELALHLRSFGILQFAKASWGGFPSGLFGWSRRNFHLSSSRLRVSSLSWPLSLARSREMRAHDRDVWSAVVKAGTSKETGAIATCNLQLASSKCVSRQTNCCSGRSICELLFVGI